MIPILYNSTETAFLSNGKGRLTECISCEVTEEINGIYECAFKYPVTGKLYQDLIAGGIVAVIHDDNHDVQPFDIYKYSAPTDGVVTFNARHISYRLSNIVIMPFSATSCADAIAKIVPNSLPSNPFSFLTDKSVSSAFSLAAPKSCRSLLCGEAGSILDEYGKGEYKFDKFVVNLYVNRGVDTGVTVMYRKNLSEIEHVNDRGGTFNAIAPYWISQEGEVVYLPEGYVAATGFTDIKVVVMDFSSEFEERPTLDQLRFKAGAYLDMNTPWIATDNVTVNFVQLWQTKEYEDYAALQSVRLCDKVSVYFTQLGIVKQKQKVVKVVYDVLQEKYSSMEIGQILPTYGQVLQQEIDGQLKLKVDRADINAAIINYLTANNVTAQNLTIVDANDNVLATFNANGITLGQTNEAHAELDFNSFILKDKDGNTYFSVGDERDENGEVGVTLNYTGDGSTVDFALSPFCSPPSNLSTISVTVDGVVVSNYTQTSSLITFSTAPSDGKEIVITYTTDAALYHYDIGKRKAGSNIGLQSIVSGGLNVGSQPYSLAIGGSNNEANAGYSSIVGGTHNTATGDKSSVCGGIRNKSSGARSSVCGGDLNEAKGLASFVGGGIHNTAREHGAVIGGVYNAASGDSSAVVGGKHNSAGLTVESAVVCGGEGNSANGKWSFASGKEIRVLRRSTFAFGEYNAVDSSGQDGDARGDYVEIVGNGTADNARSNARTLDWNGNEYIAGALNVGDAATTRTNLGALKGFGTRTAVALPYTVTNDGFFEVRLRATATGRMYANFPSINIIADAYQAASAYFTTVFPIVKGTEIPSPTLSNVMTAEYFWTPLT